MEDAKHELLRNLVLQARDAASEFERITPQAGSKLTLDETINLLNQQIVLLANRLNAAEAAIELLAGTSEPRRSVVDS